MSLCLGLSGLSGLSALGLFGACTGEGGEVLQGPEADTALRMGLSVIEAAPEHLRGRVALSSGARVYARPTFSGPSYELRLSEPPLTAGESLPRARAMRVVGVVNQPAGGLGRVGAFLALTNDLDGEDEDPAGGCGKAVDGLGHLRMLVYVPEVHLAPVLIRPIEGAPFAGSLGEGEGESLEFVRVGPGARVGEPLPSTGLPTPPAGSSWRWIDADGIRALLPVPEDAVGLAYDPGIGPERPEERTLGEALLRDAEGSLLWLEDPGGASVELTLRNDCADHWRRVVDGAEVETLRTLSTDAFYDQGPDAEGGPRLSGGPVVEEGADFRILSGAPLRWPDGELAGELLADWSVAVGVGQTWGDQRCFALGLGEELQPMAAPALACVAPKFLEALGAPGTAARFGVENQVERGGSIELGPAQPEAGGPWDEQALRVLVNGHHETVGECLRPLLTASSDAPVAAARWNLHLSVDARGVVEEVEVEALGPTLTSVDECLRVEAYGWLMPSTEGVLLVPVTLGEWAEESGAAASFAEDMVAADDEDTLREPGTTKARSKERGKVLVIGDDDELEELEELGPAAED